MFFFPFSTDLSFDDPPYGNILLIVLISVISLLSIFTGSLNLLMPQLILYDWNPIGLLGHMFLHDGIWHLFGNMLLMWVFGNAICAKFGDIYYVLTFILMGVLAATIYLIFDGDPAVGASGALYGIIGIHVALHPVSKVNWFWWAMGRQGTVEVTSYLLIGFWVIQDAVGFWGGDSDIAYIGHIGGFAAGIILGLAVPLAGLPANQYDKKSLADIIFRR